MSRYRVDCPECDGCVDIKPGVYTASSPSGALLQAIVASGRKAQMICGDILAHDGDLTMWIDARSFRITPT